MKIATGEDDEGWHRKKVLPYKKGWHCTECNCRACYDVEVTSIADEQPLVKRVSVSQLATKVLPDARGDAAAPD